MDFLSLVMVSVVIGLCPCGRHGDGSGKLESIYVCQEHTYACGDLTNGCEELRPSLPKKEEKSVKGAVAGWDGIGLEG